MEAYLTVFSVAFLAATVLPGYSEFALAGLQAAGYPAAALWLWATAGNTLGSVVNWILGRFVLRFEGSRWFPFRLDQLERSQAWFQRYGVYSLLLAWAPVGGDALTFVAGVMRVPILPFLLLVAAGKGARYALVLGLVSLWTGAG